MPPARDPNNDISFSDDASLWKINSTDCGSLLTESFQLGAHASELLSEESWLRTLGWDSWLMTARDSMRGFVSEVSWLRTTG